MKNRIILKCSAIIFALFLFGCSANVEVEPPRDTTLSEVTVNGNLAIPDKEGKVWTYKLYGTDMFYNFESIEAIPSHSDATVQFDKDIKQFNKVQVGYVFTLKITVTNGKSVEEHTLNIVYAKELMFSSITVNGSHLAKPSEDGKVWTCNFYGTEPEFEIKSIVATPVENYVYIVDYEKTQGVIKLGETFSTKLTITNEGRVLEYELRITYNSDLSLSEVTVNGNPATPNEDGSVWNCKIFGTQTPYQISNIVATAKDSSAIVNVAEKTASLNFGDKFTTKISYSNNGNTKEYTLNVVYAKETTVNTVADLKVGDFEIGDIVTTRGYYTVGDNGAAHYEIMTYDYWYENVLPRDVRYLKQNNIWEPTPIDEYGNHTLKNGNVAALVGNSYTPEQWGAKGDGETNDVWPFIHMFAQVKTGEILCRSDATYILGLTGDIDKDVDNPYRSYLCGTLLGGQYFYKPIMANVKNLVIDGNGCLVTQPDRQWGNSGMGMLNFAQDIENLEIKNFRFDGKGRTMFYSMDPNNFDETKINKNSNHTIFYSSGQLYLNGMPDGENHYKYGKEYNVLEPNASFKPSYIKNLNIHHNSFNDPGAMYSKAGDSGGDFILIINPTALDGLFIEDNVFENWGRWVFAIDLGGEGERLYNIKFNRNQCLGANREEVVGYDNWKWRALGLIDFETKKCFENVEFIGNTVIGSAGWAINGNSKVNRNFVIKDNYWQHLGGGYPYGFELYSGIGSNIVFEGNELVGVGVKPGYFTHDFTFINNYMTSSVRTAGVAGTIRFENNTSEERGFVRHLWNHVSNNYDDSFITMEQARKDRIKVIFKNNDCFMGAMFNNFAEPEKDMAKYFDFDLDYDVIMKSEVTAFNSNLAIDFQKAKYDSQSLYFNGVKSIGPLVDKNAISAIYFKKGQTAVNGLQTMGVLGGKFFREDLVENFNTYNGCNWGMYAQKHGYSNVALECTEDGYLPGACQYGFRNQVTHIKYFTEPDANGNRVKAQDNAYICTDEDLYFTIAGGALDIVPTHKEGAKVYTNSDGTTIELIYIGKLGKFKLVTTPKE